MADKRKPEDGAESTFLSHLVELRNRVAYALLGVAVVSLPALYFFRDIYRLIALPLLAKMPGGSSMIATEVASPFVAPLKLALVVSFIVAVPWVLYQIWAFVAPGLYRHERRLTIPLLASSVVLFYAGMAFAYFVVFPLVFEFFVSAAPEGVTVMTDIRAYLDFVFGMFIAFGIAFEIPVAIVLLALMGVLNPQTLADKRPYVFLGIFVVAAVVTPPDVFSQTFLGLPMYVLFEVGLFFARRVYRPRDVVAATGDDSPAG